MAELFSQLESNDLKLVDEAKRKIYEQINIVKEPWLINGIFDYYLTTNSVRSMEILINIREPHHEVLFNKLCESIRKSDTKFQALTLLGHVVRKHPTWLYKITQHNLFKDILKLLKNETDIMPLLSALLVFIVLLPCVPAFMGPYLQDVFEIFSRLAAWNCNNPAKFVEEQMVHMQVGLYALFQRLYGMYPCNFVTYLRNHYRNKDVSPIFTHTIKPMLQTVQMHPLLVITSKDFEITTDRWKRMDAHDVILECERYSMDLKDRFSHDHCFAPTAFRSRSGTTNSTIESPYQCLKSLQTTHFDNEFFSPSQLIMQSHTPTINETLPTSIPHYGTGQSLSALQSQEGTSPPEAAIEATPETTPIKDLRLLSNRPHAVASAQQASVVRALNSFGPRSWATNAGASSANTTPTHSQPSSPMRKDFTTFNFTSDRSAFVLPKRDSLANQRLQKLIQDRTQAVDNLGDKTSAPPPTSPLRIISQSGSTNNSIPSSPLPIQPQAGVDSPISQEDEEVVAIVKQGDFNKQQQQHTALRHCDSVLHDADGGCKAHENETSEDCGHGSPCTSGGLHMPNIKQMTAFRNNMQRMQRLRYYSQCATTDGGDLINSSTGSSPGNNSVPLNNIKVRRANSCPEMKKGITQAMIDKDNVAKTLIEHDEETMLETTTTIALQNGVQHHHHHHHQHQHLQQQLLQLHETQHVQTQTDNFWPMPYEHLFLSIFPALDSVAGGGDGGGGSAALIRQSPAPSPAPLLHPPNHDKFATMSFYDILDRYIDVACQINESGDPVKETKDQMQLIYQLKGMKDQMKMLHQQLLFERHRRETHAIKNRTLFTDLTKNKVLEEHNSALTDQVKLQERDIDALKQQIEIYRKDKHVREMAALDTANYWETKFKEMERKSQLLQGKNEDLQNSLDLEKLKVQELDNKWQIAEAALLNAEAEVKIAKEQVLAGEKGRIELEQVNRELLLAGETIIKYKELLSDLSLMRKSEHELVKLTDAYKHEMNTLHQQLEMKITALEAYKTRVNELEQVITQHEDAMAQQKKWLNEVKDEWCERVKAVESKYATQLAINRSLELKILELQQAESVMRRGLHSPDTSSCHEVNATLTDRTSTAPGFSPHSSPLSASLTSSDGSLAFTHSDVKEVKNLQIIVDQKDNPNKCEANDSATMASGSGGEPSPMPTTSTKTTDF